MKRLIFIVAALFLSMLVSAQVTIQMEKEAGVYKVPCTVNGVKMKFIFDTGAATVSMSQTMAQFLLDGDYLSPADIIGTGHSQLADGRFVNHATIVLRDVEIGGMHIHNIEATVIEGQNAPLLLGQTAISELGRVSMEGNRLIIHSADAGLNDQQIEELSKQIDRLIDAHSYEAAIDYILKIESACGLSEYGLYLLCKCYCYSEQCDDCIEASKRWLSEYESIGEIDNKMDVYDFLGFSYVSKMDYHAALSWYQKELDIWENCDLTNIYSSDFYENRSDLRAKANICYQVATCYRELKSFRQAERFYEKCIRLMCQHLNVSMDDVKNGKVKDDRLGFYFAQYASFFYDQNREMDCRKEMLLAALCGNQLAKDFIKTYGVTIK